MSEFGNPFEGTAPPLPIPNGPALEPPKKRGRPKGWKKTPVVRAAKAPKPAKAKRGGRRVGKSPPLAVLHGKAKDIYEIAASVQAPPSFAGSDNVAGLLASLDEVDVKLFFDMYRALSPREAPDRRTIIAALQASFV